MATTAQMQRPYPPIYQTPQSNSPASVASQAHDQHGRNLYTQSPQMPSQMYGYPPYSPIPPSPYAAHPSPQPHPLTSQPMMMPPQTTTAQMAPHQPTHMPNAALSSSPAMKMDTIPPPSSSQRSMLNPPLPTPHNAGIQPSNLHQTSPLGTSSSAAPGPIPATTPLVVRQDSNGVQWIAFEYSRDRVKMEYTIRCDVESVNVDTLSQDFKTENCVYPRACCSKDQYRGNRLVYETECNAVGWALAELNPALRGKRGLIQRAVDSWRNSNQDPRLRSRRVRRQAKVNYRKQSIAPPTPHMAAGPVGGPSLPSTSAMPPVPRPNIGAQGPLAMGPPQLHHHHAQPDGSPKIEEVSALLSAPSNLADFHPLHQTFTRHTSSIRPPFPPSTAGPAMPPLLHDPGLAPLARHPTIATAGPAAASDDESSPTNDDLFRALPAGKRRTFILVEDPQRGARVRVKVMLDKVNMDEIPDSYRATNAVFPRAYFPVQMRAPGRPVPPRRFLRGVDDDNAPESTLGRTLVPAPSLDGECEVGVPRLSRRQCQKEVWLNDLGCRLGWSQSRVFAGRRLFLQRSMLAAGQDATEIPEHFDTRRGKRRFLERRGRHVEAGGAGSAAQRSVEEVEG
ncbi:hypothetical protein N7462_003905 [Penicillium macrosclerotiorum]|uniref:uncharacterized protein n=1 Tax=Penicillium macrosclerotiorum TaxID=303699 RepID=UPI002549671A|nr:uncharacterized protein N7462_003905 [Penicillium macrosclerotiorum]KAJ5689513.1 hypothetical protein N7462_003905 [Penicillium macrosclerotiorum]